MQLNYRRGQWVKFKPLAGISGAHTLANGFVVGIFHPAAYETEVSVIDKDGKVKTESKWVEARVYVCAKNGNNLPFIDDKQNIHQRLWFPPEACPQLQSVLTREEIPEERLATSRKDWTPRP